MMLSDAATEAETRVQATDPPRRAGVAEADPPGLSAKVHDGLRPRAYRGAGRRVRVGRGRRDRGSTGGRDAGAADGPSGGRAPAAGPADRRAPLVGARPGTGPGAPGSQRVSGQERVPRTAAPPRPPTSWRHSRRASSASFGPRRRGRSHRSTGRRRRSTGQPPTGASAPEDTDVTGRTRGPPPIPPVGGRGPHRRHPARSTAFARPASTASSASAPEPPGPASRRPGRGTGRAAGLFRKTPFPSHNVSPVRRSHGVDPIGLAEAEWRD
ncbi:hypothetical protein SAMN05216505_10749 [Streptomyces prasinopilosus]|uniref:Uncharacterized protein n=1 Tax=Streptomyces prasinopilosus TaxID=67344 RepID=A0A1G6U6W7_9ACTN|nr:hypothetical protein SAMN05216505_10749 [Streptomyces prasinopilosus]